jgi:hypothetical protein
MSRTGGYIIEKLLFVTGQRKCGAGYVINCSRNNITTAHKIGGGGGVMLVTLAVAMCTCARTVSP